MPPPDGAKSPPALRCCPFCAHHAPMIAATGSPAAMRVAVMCPECGAVGPLALADDTPAHAVHLWNQRFGQDH